MSLSSTASNRIEKPATAPGSADIAQRILEAVTQLVPRFRERAVETEQRRRVSDESIRELTEAGVFKATIPVEYGGYALAPSQLCPIFAEIARGCGSTGWVAWLTATGAYPATLFSHQFQAELFGPGWDGPLQSGSINSFAPGVGRRVPGGLMIKGKWGWISGCHHTRSHLFSVTVDTDDGGKESVTCQVPHEQIEIIDDWTVMGMQGSGSNTVIIREEIFVPEHRIIKSAAMVTGERPAPHAAGVLFKVSFGELGAVTSAALGIGLARAAIEEFQKKSAGKPIAFTPYPDRLKAPVTHLQLGEMWAKLNACESIAQCLAAQMESNAERNIAPTPLSFVKARAAGAYVCLLAREISDLALRTSGASSIHLSSPLQRIMRDATTLSMHAHTTIETCYENLGRVMTGGPAPGGAPRQS